MKFCSAKAIVVAIAGLYWFQPWKLFTDTYVEVDGCKVHLRRGGKGEIQVWRDTRAVFGGKLADRRPEPRLLGSIVLAAALFIAVLPFVSRPILDVAVRGLDAVSVGAVVGSFFAALALFAIPVTLLGAVSPFAIRLALDDVGEAGTVDGLDHVAMRHRVLDLVGLQRPDQVEREVGMPLAVRPVLTSKRPSVLSRASTSRAVSSPSSPFGSLARQMPPSRTALDCASWKSR